MTPVYSTLVLIFNIVVVSGTCQNCLGSCDSDGVCMTQCKAGFAGKTCDPCPLNCISGRCELDENIGIFPCTFGCKPGYYGLQCNTQCQSTDSDNECDRHTGHPPVCDGQNYGDTCEQSCSQKCSGFSCDNEGNCLDSCVDGWYGDSCEHKCNGHCSVCKKKLGECIQCEPGFYGNDCSVICSGCLGVNKIKIYKSIPGCAECEKEEKNNGQLDNWSKEFFVILCLIAVFLVVITIVQLFIAFKIGTTIRTSPKTYTAEESTCGTNGNGLRKRGGYKYNEDENIIRPLCE